MKKTMMFLSMLGFAFAMTSSVGQVATATSLKQLPPREHGRAVVYYHGETYRFFLNRVGNLEYTMGHDRYRFNLGGVLTSAPYAVNFNDDIYILGRGTDGAVYYRTLHAGWVSLGGFVNQITEIYRQGGDIYIYGRSGDQLWTRTLYTGWRRIR